MRSPKSMLRAGPPAPRSTGAREEGYVLVLTLIVLLVVASLGLSATSVVHNQLVSVGVTRNRIIARQAALSGVARQLADLALLQNLAALDQPFAGFDDLDTNQVEGTGGYTLVYDGEPLLDVAGNAVAEYDVLVDVQGSGQARTVHITCYAYVPDKSSYLAGVRDAVKADAHAVSEVKLRGGEVFDYAYFINHWGWFFGDSITSNGSVRSNGNFDFGGYRATVNGSPRYEDSDGYHLLGYQDDNGDGIMDGSDGGVYSGMRVVNAQNVRGMGGDASNQHEFLPQAPMPNLSDLSPYEEKALNDGGTISVGGRTYVSGVLGDDPGEKTHLFLVGTPSDPVVLNGPVVVRGSVILSGVVTGQGSIYAAGNIYVPGNLTYLNGPDTPRPAANDQASVEAWRRDAADRDSLGLFAREHIVIGDYTHSWWQYYVSNWISHPLNKSAEDAGADGIQNTKAGPDGILGTADDDVLEDDGVWTVSYYTQADADAGRIPPGKHVGDVIPGSGEDIDGDGSFDGPTQMSEFDIPAPLDPSHWEGNMDQPYADYSDISTIYIDHLDGAFYTNHTLAALMINWGGLIEWNGAIVSRNESIIYGANGIVMNHDERLTGRGGESFGFYSPLTWEPVEVLQWEVDRYVPASSQHDPAAIVAYYTGGQ